MTQDFQVSVTPVGNDEYLIRTERVAPGVPLAEEQVVWCVEDWLVQARQLMNDPLLTILRGGSALPPLGTLRSQPSGQPPTRTGTAADPREASSIFDLVSLGQRLYGALFQGTIRDSWMTAQGIAQHRQELLRLRLGLKGDRLWRLPWEVLHGGDRPLATGTDVVFSRYQFGTGMVRAPLRMAELTLKPGQPLRILMAISAPTDQERLDLTREALHLKEELLVSNSTNGHPPLSNGAATTTDIQLTILEQPDREQLTRELEQGHYQILHYAGHSSLGTAGGDIYLVSGRTGLTETLSGDDLAGLLVNNGIRLAVFNSCRGAYVTDTPEAAGERNLAEALIRRGVPAVLAMAERIPDEVALTLTRLFYRNLKQGYAIDLSLSRTRQGLLSAYGSNQLYWALPILYLNPEFDGCLVAARDDQAGDQGASPVNPGVLSGDPQEIWSDGVPQDILATPIVPPTTQPISALSSTPAQTDQQTSDHRADPAPMYSAQSSPTEDLVNLVDDLEYDNSPGHNDDAGVMSDLIRQLSQSDVLGQDHSETDIRDENLLPDDMDRTMERYKNTVAADHDRHSNQPTDTAALLEAKIDEITTRDRSETMQAIQGNPPSPKLVISTTPDQTEPLIHPHPPRKWGVYLGIVVSGMAIGGVLFWGWRTSWQWVPQSATVSPPPALPSSTVPIQSFNPNTSNLKAIATNDLTAIAVAKFNQGDLPAGGRALEELLDRVALKEAETAMATVPSNLTGDAYISFLRGRLAWQFLQQPENHPYSLDDVRRSWEIAVRQQPKSTLYRNALGFVYYAENRLPAAEEQWADVLELLNSQAKPAKTVQGKPGTPPAILTRNADALTAQAGIALALATAAENKPPAERDRLLSLATDQYRSVISKDPINFQRQALGQNWLWTEGAIQQWQALGKQR